jgi:hypothetical protein
VLYAGLSSLYFPRASELAAVEIIAAHLASRRDSIPLVYRPVEDDAEERARIDRFCAALPNVSVQWPAATEVGLNAYPNTDVRQSLREYAGSLAGCRLMIMSNTTSMMIDASKLERCGVIGNLVDPSGVLERRQLDLLRRDWIDVIPFARTYDELRSEIDRLLTDTDAAHAMADSLVAAWDYPHDEFEARLLTAVFGRTEAERFQ